MKNTKNRTMQTKVRRSPHGSRLCARTMTVLAAMLALALAGGTQHQNGVEADGGEFLKEGIATVAAAAATQTKPRARTGGKHGLAAVAAAAGPDAESGAGVAAAPAKAPRVAVAAARAQAGTGHRRGPAAAAAAAAAATLVSAAAGAPSEHDAAVLDASPHQARAGQQGLQPPEPSQPRQQADASVGVASGPTRHVHQAEHPQPQPRHPHQPIQPLKKDKDGGFLRRASSYQPHQPHQYARPRPLQPPQPQLQPQREERARLQETALVSGTETVARQQWRQPPRRQLQLELPPPPSASSSRQTAAAAAAAATTTTAVARVADKRWRSPGSFRGRRTGNADVELAGTLAGHSSGVNSVAFSPDGSLVASGSGDDTIKLWRVSDRTLLGTLAGHSSWVYSVAFSPDASLVASGSEDNGIKLWRVSDRTLLGTLTGHSGDVLSVAFSPDASLVASGSLDNTIKLWRVSGRTLLGTLAGHSRDVDSVAFSPDGSLVASGSDDRTIKLWRVSDRTLLGTLAGHSNSVYSVAFSPDGSLVASGSLDKTIKLWRVSDRTLLGNHTGHSSYVLSVAFSPDAALLASGSYDDTIKVWQPGACPEDDACSNRGTCTTNGFKNALDGLCTCDAGYTGTDCEIDIDDCPGVTCSNHGTCSDGSNAYTCECDYPWSGPDCELCNGANPNLTLDPTPDCNGVTASQCQAFPALMALCPIACDSCIASTTTTTITSTTTSATTTSATTTTTTGLCNGVGDPEECGHDEPYTYASCNLNSFAGAQIRKYCPALCDSCTWTTTTNTITTTTATTTTITISTTTTTTATSSTKTTTTATDTTATATTTTVTKTTTTYFNECNRHWLEVGCETKTTDSATGWTKDDEPLGHVQCCSNAGETCTRRDNSGNCFSGDASTTATSAPKKTYAQAAALCAAAGRRLCTKDELLAKTSSGCCGAGCSYDVEAVWTQTAPCSNNGQCVDGISSHSCKCTPGWSGDDCEVNIDECEGKTCSNRGSCTDGVNQYTCTCDQGFKGTNCQININECAGKTCSNHGSCSDGANKYTCNCDPGYTGKDCEINIDECVGKSCSNHGSCTDGVNKYTCSCIAGWAGTDCETDINECQGKQCSNHGSCDHGIDEYTCTCEAGYTGKDCEVNIDECAGKSCSNHGSCADGVNRYTCTCIAGWTGTDCETDINECQGRQCSNHGSCDHGIDEYTCTCEAGYTGKDCEVNIDECKGESCSNHGSCTDGVNRYTCTCTDGWGGSDCELCNGATPSLTPDPAEDCNGVTADLCNDPEFADLLTLCPIACDSCITSTTTTTTTATTSTTTGLCNGIADPIECGQDDPYVEGSCQLSNAVGQRVRERCLTLCGTCITTTSTTTVTETSTTSTTTVSSTTSTDTTTTRTFTTTTTTGTSTTTSITSTTATATTSTATTTTTSTTTTTISSTTTSVTGTSTTTTTMMCSKGEFFTYVYVSGGFEQQACLGCPADTYQDLPSHRQTECIEQTYCKSGQYISRESTESQFEARKCTQCDDWYFQPSTAHRELVCNRAPITTCNNAGNFNPAAGECDCFNGYSGDTCSDVAPGCRLGNNAMQSKIDAAATRNVAKVIPPVAAISGTSVVVAYVYLLNGGDPNKASSFFKLSWQAHAWAVMSVGMKIFDLQTDFSFFFISLRGEPFESQFMVPDVVNEIQNGTGNATSVSSIGRRFTNEGRYDSNVNAIQLVAFTSCILGALFTFCDMYGTRQRLLQDVGLAMKITIAVLLFEDVPQLVITITYMLTIAKGASTTPVNENEPGVPGVVDLLEDIDAISIVSLVASIVSLLYSVYLLLSDRRVLAAQQRELDDRTAQIEAALERQHGGAPKHSPNPKAYKPSDSTFANPAFSKHAQSESSRREKEKGANSDETERCPKCNAKTSTGCMCDVRRNTAGMGRPIVKVKSNAEIKTKTPGKHPGKPGSTDRAAHTVANRTPNESSKKEQVQRVAMANIAGFETSDVGKPCIVIDRGSGTIRFVGLHAEFKEARVGVEMNKPKGINNGTVKGHTYFKCKEGFGILTHPSKVKAKASSSATKAKPQNHARAKTVDETGC